jgi:hypothetical protein
VVEEGFVIAVVLGVGGAELGGEEEGEVAHGGYEQAVAPVLVLQEDHYSHSDAGDDPKNTRQVVAQSHLFEAVKR